MSAEWRHRPHEREHTEGGTTIRHGFDRCAGCGEMWPCDAEKMRVERDAAIRRASDIEQAAMQVVGKVVVAAGGEVRVTRRLLVDDVDVSRSEDPRTLDTVYRAVLRSQESQKPPETEDR